MTVLTGRMMGNTTRLVDQYIQDLFNNKRVELKDHYENGTYEPANKYLLRIFQKRIEIEHSRIRVKYDREGKHYIASIV